MRISLGLWVLATGVLAISVQAWAQSPAAAPSSSAAPEKLSKEAVKKGSAVGFQARLTKEGVLYCKDDATIGTRIKSTHCFTDTEFDTYLIRLKAARDDMQRQGCTGGDNCNASKGQKP